METLCGKTGPGRFKSKNGFFDRSKAVGKTTLAKRIITQKQSYLNWDIPNHREAILRGEMPAVDLWAFDEIHKYTEWRNFLKGLYDQFGNSKQILVTGSARLGYYRFSGDSLQGRYHMLRLLPLSVAELNLSNQDDLLSLLKLGGFPEPFFSGSEREARRWSREYRTLMLSEEVRTLEQVKELGKMELLYLRLPECVGSPLSLNALRMDLGVAHKTVGNWLEIFERLYGIFFVAPFGAPKIRAVKKEQKHYHFDWTQVKDDAFRFENMIAVHLLKWCHFQQDVEGRDVELRYFRDIDRREVDFVIVEDRHPLMFIEVKWNDKDIAKGLSYLNAKFPNVPAMQISAVGQKDYVNTRGIRVRPALSFLKALI